MKKLLCVSLIGALVALCAPQAHALMDSKDYTLSVSGTATTSQQFVIRGEIEAVRVVTVPTGATGTVTVASAEQTVFSKSGITTAATYVPRVGTQSYAGVPLSYDATATNFQAVADNFAVAGPVTTTVIGASPTNGTWVIRVIFNR